MERRQETASVSPSSRFGDSLGFNRARRKRKKHFLFQDQAPNGSQFVSCSQNPFKGDTFSPTHCSRITDCPKQTHNTSKLCTRITSHKLWHNSIRFTRLREKKQSIPANAEITYWELQKKIPIYHCKNHNLSCCLVKEGRRVTNSREEK